MARDLQASHSAVVTGLARRGAGKPRAHRSVSGQARGVPPALRSLVRLSAALGGPPSCESRPTIECEEVAGLTIRDQRVRRPPIGGLPFIGPFRPTVEVASKN